MRLMRGEVITVEHVVTTQRKPPGRELHVIAAVRVRSGKQVVVTEGRRASIARQAEELWAHGSVEEISRTIARREGIPEAAVDAVLVGVLVQRDRELAAIKAILANAPGMAAEVGEQVWEDVA